MVFYGDELVENLNGRTYDKPTINGMEINQYFRKTFTNNNEHSTIDAAALGITGDMVRGNNAPMFVHHHVPSIPDCEFVSSDNRRPTFYIG